MRTWLGVAVLTVATLAGCGSSGGAGAVGDKYTQTWTKSYSDTTCADWYGHMTEKQKWVAAADMLASARSADGATALPLDALVDTFASGMATSCVIDTMNIAEIGAGLYLTERSRFAP